jgi:hypothetical protein
MLNADFVSVEEVAFPLVQTRVAGLLPGNAPNQSFCFQPFRIRGWASLLARSPLGDTAGQSALHALGTVAFRYLMRTGIAASRQKAELHGESATSRTRKSREGATSLEDVPLIIVIIIPKKE